MVVFAFKDFYMLLQTVKFQMCSQKKNFKYLSLTQNFRPGFKGLHGHIVKCCVLTDGGATVGAGFPAESEEQLWRP